MTEANPVGIRGIAAVEFAAPTADGEAALGRLLEALFRSIERDQERRGVL